MFGSGQALVLSLHMSHGSKSLLPGVWWHKGWLADPERGLSGKVVEVSFPINEMSRLQAVMLKATLSTSQELTV